jgi:excisionase family DNA binding protein
MVDREALPLVLTMGNIQKIAKLSKGKTYDMLHMAGFPAIRFGRAIRVPRDAFFEWLEKQAGK